MPRRIPRGTLSLLRRSDESASLALDAATKER
jgi:hypothetical protein